MRCFILGEKFLKVECNLLLFFFFDIVIGNIIECWRFRKFGF